MSISTEQTIDSWWRRLRPRLTILYLVVVLALVGLSLTGHTRLLNEVGKTFGGFFWAIDTDGKVVIVSTPVQLPPFAAHPNSLSSSDYIVSANNVRGRNALSQVYSRARPGQMITYQIEHNGQVQQIQRPTTQFDWDMWLQNYGMTLLAGMSWLLVGFVLFATSPGWLAAVEGITLLPAAMLLLLSCHWGNVQTANPADLVFELVWVPSFALLGAAFIHLSLTYRPERMGQPRRPTVKVDALPYLPLIALLAFEWSSYLIFGQISTRLNLLFSLSYGALGGALALYTGISSLLRIRDMAPNVRRRVADLFTIWVGGLGLGFCTGILPILLTGHTLLPLPIFLVLAAAYPILLLYAIRSLRMMDRLHVILEQREAAYQEQWHTAEKLSQTNQELETAQSLLLHADSHLRSLLSQRIHDQPKQQALRIRSLLGHWQHKLRQEAQKDPQGRVYSQQIIEALEKVRKISEELESDLRSLQLLVEDTYQRKSLGLRLHLEKLIREDLPARHPESSLKIHPELWELDSLGHDLEKTEIGERVAEAISYTITQALLNIYNHAAAESATVQAICQDNSMAVYIIDDGKGFDQSNVAPDKTSLFKARLKARNANGSLEIHSVPKPQVEHGTTVILRVPIPQQDQKEPMDSLAEKIG